MKNSDIKNTLGGTRFGSSLKDLADGDLAHGYFDAAPSSDYGARTRHAGHIEEAGYTGSHGSQGEYGFVRRPLYKSDVERN